MTDERKKLLNDAANALDKLYKFIGTQRNEETLVYCLAKDLDEGREVITVEIGKGTYRVNVECDSVPAIIREVVDATVLKI